MDDAQAVDRQVERAAAVFKVQKILRDSAKRKLHEATVLAESVLVVHHQLAQGDAGQVPEGRSFAGRCRPMRARSEDFLLGDDDDAVARQLEAVAQRSRPNA